MASEKAHAIALELFEPLPETLDLGVAFSLAVAVTATSRCDLAGAAYQVLHGEAVVSEGVLPDVRTLDAEGHDPRNGLLDTREHVRIALQAPREIGAFDWVLVLPAQDIAGVAHARASLAFSFCTGEHRTSLAVWDVPSPVVAGERFSFKVGAKCSACCGLGGRQVELRDAQDRVIAEGALGDTLLADSEGLYWVEMQATAPAVLGLQQYTVAFAAADLALPHQSAAAAMSFVTVEPGRHAVSVTIVDRGAPVVDAQVRLGFHRSASDAHGVARFVAPDGEQRLFIWKSGFEAPEQTIDVTGDLALTIEAKALPEENPYARWQG